MTDVRFSARGAPVAQGSVKAFVRGNRAVVVAKGTGPLADWRHAIATEARAAMLHLPAFGGPVTIYATFTMSRPPSHFRTDGQTLAKSAARYPRLDLDKLCRALLDALTGVAFDDDSQVAILSATKQWDDDNRGWQGVDVVITEIDAGAGS
jgi:crossover junction endodeoxyribonuclease RusA